MSKVGTHFFNHTYCLHYFGERLENLMHSTKQQKGASLPGKRTSSVPAGTHKDATVGAPGTAHLTQPGNSVPKAGPLLCLNLPISFCQTSTISFTWTERLTFIPPSCTCTNHCGPHLLILCLLFQTPYFMYYEPFTKGFYMVIEM